MEILIDPMILTRCSSVILLGMYVDSGNEQSVGLQDTPAREQRILSSRCQLLYDFLDRHQKDQVLRIIAQPWTPIDQQRNIHPSISLQFQGYQCVQPFRLMKRDPSNGIGHMAHTLIEKLSDTVEIKRTTPFFG